MGSAAEDWWGGRVGKHIQKDAPRFNRYLLKDYRREKMEQLDQRLADHYRASIELINIDPRAKSQGWDPVIFERAIELTPDERLEYISGRKSKGNFDIAKNDMKVLRFEFSYQGEVYPLHVAVPIMDNYGVANGSISYPILPIVERGINRLRNGLKIKLTRVNLQFWRTTEFSYKSTNGCRYNDIVVTSKIHQKTRGKKSPPPLLVYYLASFGLIKTLREHGVEDDEIVLVDQDSEEKGYQYFELGQNIFLRVKCTTLKQMYKRRIVASLMTICKYYKKFTITDLLDGDGTYFKIALGRYTYPSIVNEKLSFKNAVTHLGSTEALMDTASKTGLQRVGIKVNNIYDLLKEMFFIDKYLTDFTATDLYDKKIASLDQMMSGLIEDFNRKVYDLVNSKRGLNHDSLRRLINYSAKPNIGWCLQSEFFRSNPSTYNGNYLLTIGAKRIRSLDNPELRPNRGKAKTMPIALLKAHPSQAVVESAGTFPSSNPIASGSINGYLDITPEGDIIKPPWHEAIKNIYK